MSLLKTLAPNPERIETEKVKKDKARVGLEV